MNVAQSFIISLGVGSTLTMANYFVGAGQLTVGGFVMFNSYNLQIYAPLGFLGALWRFIRQNMVDVEQVLNLMELDTKIPEVARPIKANVRFAEI